MVRCRSFFLTKCIVWTGNFTKSVGIQTDSVLSDLSTLEVSVSTFPPTSALEEL